MKKIILLPILGMLSLSICAANYSAESKKAFKAEIERVLQKNKEVLRKLKDSIKNIELDREEIKEMRKEAMEKLKEDFKEFKKSLKESREDLTENILALYADSKVFIKDLDEKALKPYLEMLKKEYSKEDIKEFFESTKDDLEDMVSRLKDSKKHYKKKLQKKLEALKESLEEYVEDIQGKSYQKSDIPLNGSDNITHKKLKELKSMKQIISAIDSSQIAVIDVYIKPCSSCMELSPLLEEAQNKFSESINFYKVNALEVKEFAEKYNIDYVPVLLIFKDGKLVERNDNVPNTQSELNKLFSSLI